MTILNRDTTTLERTINREYVAAVAIGTVLSCLSLVNLANGAYELIHNKNWEGMTYAFYGLLSGISAREILKGGLSEYGQRKKDNTSSLDELAK